MGARGDVPLPVRSAESSSITSYQSGFHPGFPSRGDKCSNCQVKGGGGGEDLVVFLGFVGERILWYNSNYSNKGPGSGGALPGKF